MDETAAGPGEPTKNGLPRRRAGRSLRLTVGVLGGLIAACTGNVESVPGVSGAGQASATGSTSASGGTVGSTITTAPQTTGFQPAPSALRKLTVRQYQNTALDLFGADADLTTTLEPDTALNGFYSIGASKSTVSPSAAEKFETSAYALAAKALDSAHRVLFVGCTPAGVQIGRAHV